MTKLAQYFAVFSFVFFLTGCLQSRDPVFLPSEGDDMGSSFKIIESISSEKPVEMIARKNAGSGNSYKVTYTSDNSIRSRQVIYKFITEDEDGSIYVSQVFQTQVDTETGKVVPAYTLFPIKLNDDGYYIQFNFLYKDQEFKNIAAKHRIKFAMFTEQILVDINPNATQCFIQEIIEKKLYRSNLGKDNFDGRLIGYHYSKDKSGLDCN